MDARLPEHADRLLDAALAMEPGARLAFIRASTAGDDELRARLEAILVEAEAPDGFLAPGGLLSGPLAADFAAGDEERDQRGVLQPGSRLAGYEVIELAGRGGMGEVYRARDVRLGRMVALKILPDRFSQDAERLARFEREARVLAALSHPRIGSIHGIAEHGALRVLVLEWVDGGTLADRLAAGPLPVAEALPLAIQIGEALEAAHQRAIVHRDLKPANIKLTPDGVKVLDFGLARAAGADESAEGDSISTLHPRPGLVRGTPSYMSPEQARGERVDHRADIWAFGCILAEMLTGRRAFPGHSSAGILKRVVEDAADIGALPPALPPTIHGIIQRCLEKDPRRRLGWIGEAVLALEEGLRAPGPPPSFAAARRWWRRLWPAAGGLAVGAIAALVATPALERRPPPPVSWLAVPSVEGDELVAGDLPTVAISRDGRQIVYRARRAGTVQLFHRALERSDPEPIPNSEHAVAPFLSPDGTWVGFSRDGALLKTPVAGGTPVTLCEVPGAVTAVWLPRGEIVFGGDLTRGLQRVSDAGGRVEPLTTLASGEQAHTDPDYWEASGVISFTIRSGSPDEIAVVSPDGRTRQVLTQGSQARLIGRHLVFMRQGALWAAPVDPRRAALDGAPGPALERVEASVVTGSGHYAVSPTGTLVYLPKRTPRSRERQIVWVDRAGLEDAVPVEPGPFTRAAVAPDGGSIALAASGAEGRDLWLYSTARGTLTQIRVASAADTAPVWTPDGARLIFRSDRDGGGLFVVNPEDPQQLMKLTSPGDRIHTPYDVTRDLRHVLFTEFRTYRDQGIGMAPLDGSGSITWLVDGPSAELRPRLSPDGRWLAYQSDESGRFEVYVRPFPEATAGRWQVSTDGGVSPMWAPDGRELFYYHQGTLFRVPLTGTGSFAVGAPERLFSIDVPSDRLGPTYDVSPDGRRFLFVRIPAGSAPAGPLMLVEHWREDLARSFPP